MPKPAAVREVEELEAADKWAKARMVGQEFDGTTFRDALDVVYWMRQVGGVESCGRRAGQAVVHPSFQSSSLRCATLPPAPLSISYDAPSGRKAA